VAIEKQVLPAMILQNPDLMRYVFFFFLELKQVLAAGYRIFETRYSGA